MDHDGPSCANFEAAMEVLGKPWTGLLFVALEGGPRRFSELRETVGAIGDRMLTLRLRELEEKSLVRRRVIEGPPVRVEYELTEAGRGFREVSEVVRRWGAAIVLARAHGGEGAAPATKGKQRAPAKTKLTTNPERAGRRRH